MVLVLEALWFTLKKMRVTQVYGFETLIKQGPGARQVLYWLEGFIELALGTRRRNSYLQLVAGRYSVSLPMQTKVDRCPLISYGLCQEGYLSQI